jgi:hypothetical protein
MAQKFANNAVSQLASAITDTQTNFAVLPGAGGKFPTLATGDWFMATMTAATSDGGVQREIVKVNVRGADQFTVDRSLAARSSTRAGRPARRSKCRPTSLQMLTRLRRRALLPCRRLVAR